MTNKERLLSLKKMYEDVKDNVNFKKANGSLSKLANFRSEFDTTFDLFFDDKELRLKYNAWDIEENIINTDMTNSDLEDMLDDEDLEKLCEFYDEYISDLVCELQELKNRKRSE